ncbi:hypothetical protein scyTo_0020042, partial [Scyliorhinus torazame]|nr:hypothetical protein [Scyliorhinus torazame]
VSEDLEAGKLLNRNLNFQGNSAQDWQTNKMDFTFSFGQLQALSNLLSPADQEEEDLEEQPAKRTFNLNPGQIGPARGSNPTGKEPNR